MLLNDRTANDSISYRICATNSVTMHFFPSFCIQNTHTHAYKQNSLNFSWVTTRWRCFNHIVFLCTNSISWFLSIMNNHCHELFHLFCLKTIHVICTIASKWKRLIRLTIVFSHTHTYSLTKSNVNVHKYNKCMDTYDTDVPI